jgi:hypothetical protein
MEDRTVISPGAPDLDAGSPDLATNLLYVSLATPALGHKMANIPPTTVHVGQARKAALFSTG